MAECDVPFMECSNKDLTFEQIFKQMIVLMPDGSPGLKTCGCGCEGGGVSSALPVSKTVFVNGLGDDVTALRERLDLPFATIDAAVAAAISGDTIIVLSGTYNAFQPLHKEGVNWEFIGSPSLYLYNSAKWSDNNLPTEINIQGDADIVSFVTDEVILIDNDLTKATINFRNVTGRGSNVISLQNGTGVINIQDTLLCTTVNRPLNLRNNSRFTINIDVIRNTAFAGIRPCIYTNSTTGYNIINVRLIENGINNPFACVISERIPQTGTTVINVSDEIRSLNISPYSFWKKIIFHMAGKMIINGTVNGGNTCAFSKVYGGTDISYLEHNGRAYNDGTYKLVEMNQSNSETKFNGVYETSNINVFTLGGSTKNTINGEIYNKNSTNSLKKGIETSSTTKLILGVLKVVFESVDIQSFGIFGTNASNIKIIHGISSNADVNPNITNLITGTNYVYDTDVE